MTDWLQMLVSLIGVVLAVIGGLWTYTRFVLERSLLPPTEFSLDCNCVGPQGDLNVIEILLRIRNLGRETLVAKELSVRIRYLNRDDEARLLRPAEKGMPGRLEFPRSVSDTDSGLKSCQYFKVVPHDIFVRGGVEQVCTFATGVPVGASYLLVRGLFYYPVGSSSWQKGILAVSKALGLTRYTLETVTQPHTAERVFKIP